MLELALGTLGLSLEGGQLGDLGPHQLLPGVEPSPVVEELTYLAEAESGVLPHPDHAHPVDGFGRVATLVRQPRRRRQEALALVEAQRGGRGVSRSFKFSDAQANNHLT